MPVETFASSTESPNSAQYRQAISPNYLRGTFVKDDTDNHDYIANARGKGRFTVAFSTTGSSTYLVSVYGMHLSTATVGGVGVFPISTGLPATSTGFYDVVADPFPFYMIRIQSGDTGDTGAPTATVFGDFSAF